MGKEKSAEKAAITDPPPRLPCRPATVLFFPRGLCLQLEGSVPSHLLLTVRGRNIDVL